MKEFQSDSLRLDLWSKWGIRPISSQLHAMR